MLTFDLMPLPLSLHRKIDPWRLAAVAVGGVVSEETMPFEEGNCFQT